MGTDIEAASEVSGHLTGSKQVADGMVMKMRSEKTIMWLHTRRLLSPVVSAMRVHTNKQKMSC